MHCGATIPFRQLLIFKRHRRFGKSILVVDDAAFAEDVTTQIYCDNVTCAERTAHRDRNRIDERAVDQPAAIDLNGAEDAGESEGGFERVHQTAFVEPDLVTGAELGGNGDEPPIERPPSW